MITDHDVAVAANDVALVRQARRLSMWARIVLVPVSIIGAVLSFRSLYLAAEVTIGPYLAAGFPLLVDLLILGASLQYVSGAKVGRPLAGWRLTAHAGVAGTIVLNALAAKELGQVPWHVTAPAVWAVLVELTAKQVLGEYRATHAARADSISIKLWLTAPVESARTRLLMLRTGELDAHQARITVGLHAAAREALRLALPRRGGRKVRRVIGRQLRAGSLPPSAVLGPLGWDASSTVVTGARPQEILKAVLQGVLDRAGRADSMAEFEAELQGGLEAGVQAEFSADLQADSYQPEPSMERPQPAPVAALEPEAASAPQDVTREARTADQQRRLADAADIVRRRPSIKGPELRTELARHGWAISDRTALRVLTEARAAEHARRDRPLAAVRR